MAATACFHQLAFKQSVNGTVKRPPHDPQVEEAADPEEKLGPMEQKDLEAMEVLPNPPEMWSDSPTASRRSSKWQKQNMENILK